MTKNEEYLRFFTVSCKCESHLPDFVIARSVEEAERKGRERLRCQAVWVRDTRQPLIPPTMVYICVGCVLLMSILTVVLNVR